MKIRMVMMMPLKLKPFLSLFLCGCLLLIQDSAQASFSLNDLPAKVPIKTETYTVESLELSKFPGFLKFRVRSPHAVYDIEGVQPLIKLLHEIRVIERVRQDKEGSGFLQGASDSVEATAVGIGNLVSHPVESAKGIGKAAGKLGRSVGGIFRKKDEGEKSSFGEKVMGGNEREIAKKLGVDVYTANPHLKGMISSMAKARMGGQGAVMVIKFLIPVAALASVAMTAGSINTAADQLVNDSSRIDLYQFNKVALVQMGFSEKSAKQFLDKADLTPREQTYFRFYLDHLRLHQGFKEIFEAAAQAGTPWETRKVLYEAELTAGLTRGQFQKFWKLPEGVAAQDANGGITLITAYDYLEAQNLGDTVLNRLRELKGQSSGSVTLYNGGKIDEVLTPRLRQLGIAYQTWTIFKKGEINAPV